MHCNRQLQTWRDRASEVYEAGSNVWFLERLGFYVVV